MSISRIYPHRRNKDGSYDSICLTCFLTVSHANTEAELPKLDLNHVCRITPLSKRSNYKEESTDAGRRSDVSIDVLV